MNTIVTLLEGLGRHLRWWVLALVDWRDPRAPMCPRRFLLLLVAMPVMLCVQATHVICLLLDEVLFPRYRQVEVDRALFITGIPRSGTSFLHRTLATDTDAFTTLTTWEVLFAPSILQRRIVHVLAAADRCLGGFGGRALDAATRRLAGGLDDIHEVGLRAAEEDYLTLLPAGGCFILLLAFPGARDLQALGRFDRCVPDGRRRRLLRFYRACLQRHLYVHGGQRVLLSKNAAFGSWLDSLRETFPEARFLVCVRAPGAALSSQISAVSAARALFGTAVESEPFQRIFLDGFADTLDSIAAVLGRWPSDRAAVIDMDDLRRRPARVVREALTRIGYRPGPMLCARLDALSPVGSGRHRHSVDALALDRAALDRRMESAYQRLLTSPHRIRTA